MDWEPHGRATPARTPTDYQTSLTYDALNRVKTMQYPAGRGRRRARACARATTGPGRWSVSSWTATTYVERIAYNAKGQRTLIAYGNGVMTRYAYDPQTFRLVRLRTERYTKPDLLTYQPDWRTRCRILPTATTWPATS